MARPADRLPPLSVPVHRRGGGREVMREQLARLLACTERPHITVQVLPFPLEAHAAAVGSFVTGPGPAG
ncbi:Scr1 family TA system antitoxin-like transcriptional regulator [Streptomyces coelicoflavus]|uniref:Scr1 family TA system antitoxin-like transcriptional regulator n=1 Tax=Streptomyces coelicoflavus TaxID=285562 RepID=UPI003AF32E45